MNACAELLRVVYARWCVLAAAEPVLGAAGAPLPFRVTVDGSRAPGSPSARGWVARYDASSSAGATLACFADDQAVLSCGDAGWRVPGAPSADELLGRGPTWAHHATMLDHRVRAGHFGWAAFWAQGRWSCVTGPEPGMPLPPIRSTGTTAAALAARFDDPAVEDAMFHLVRMSEYEWLDTASWEAAFGALVPERTIRESWERLVGFGLTQWSGSGPRTDGVPGRTPAEAVRVAAERTRSAGIPQDVRVDSAMRTRNGWQIRFLDYRDAARSRPLVVQVPDEEAATCPGRTPG